MPVSHAPSAGINATNAEIIELVDAIEVGLAPHGPPASYAERLSVAGQLSQKIVTRPFSCFTLVKR